jgi:hypothetical protein
MARVHAHPRSMGPKMDTLSLRYFWAPAQPLRLALVDRLGGVEACFRHVCSLISNACFPASSSLLFPPSPSSNGRLHHHGETKSHETEELGARAETNGYKRGAHREKDSTRDNGKHNKKTKRSQNSVLDRYVS